MSVIVMKFFTALWPFLKEALVGARESGDKKRRPALPHFTLLLMGALVFLGDHTMTLQKDIVDLKAKLVQARNPAELQTLKMDLYLCRKDLDNLREALVSSRDHLVQLGSCRAKLSAIHDEFDKIDELPKASVGETARERAIRKMEWLRTKEDID